MEPPANYAGGLARSSTDICPFQSAQTYWQYAVLARPNTTHPTPPTTTSTEIAQAIAQYLGAYITPADVTYRAPNFIIYFTNSTIQRQALSTSTLETRTCHIQMVPWSKEHRLAQLPWITDNTPDALKITVNPLEILPVPSMAQTHPGSHKLKDNYVRTFSTGYDLRAPDYSYLVIAELKDFYYEKFQIFRACSDRTIELLQLLQRTLRQFQDQAAPIHTVVQILANNANDDKYRYLYDFAKHLLRDTNNAYRNHDIIGSHIDLIQQQPQCPFNLDSFKKIPSYLKVPVPPSYVSRLRVIYAAATTAVYGTEGTIKIIETPAGRFEAFVTVNGSTHKYRNFPQKNPASAEALAIYYSLKQITNVLGYQIIDLNYPILAQVITAINQLNLHIGLLQSCVSYATDDMRDVYENTGHLLNEYSMAAHNIENIPGLSNSVQQLDEIITSNYNSFIGQANDFANSKTNFLCTHLDADSLTAKPNRWLQVATPDPTATNPASGQKAKTQKTSSTKT